MVNARVASGLFRQGEASRLSPSSRGLRRFLNAALQVSTANATILASAAAAALIAGNAPALADVPTPPPQIEQATKQAQNQSMTFPSSEAPKPASSLPEGNQWRYSEFIGAVEGGKVERVRFSKDGSQLQLTAVDGRRAQVCTSTRRTTNTPSSPQPGHHRLHPLPLPIPQFADQTDRPTASPCG